MHKVMFGTLAAVVLSFGAAMVHAGSPVCVLHKAETPAQKYLLVDDSSTELRGHTQHGDSVVELSYCDASE